MKIVFIADVFADQVAGGGELNNKEFIEICISKDHAVTEIKSHLVTVEFLKRNLDSKFIIGNFINLSEDCKSFLTEQANYILYEHDHKYLKNRNPAAFKEFIAPKNMIVNSAFYAAAITVLCQTGFHTGILEKNLESKNFTNLGGNLWSLESIEEMKAHSLKTKNDKCSIMNSNILHKNTAGAIRYCDTKGIEYELIDPCKYSDFLERLSKNNKFIFLPKTPETLSRIVVESRMMGMKVLTNGLVGATREEWFKFKGLELIDVMLKKRDEIPDKILGFF